MYVTTKGQYEGDPWGDTQLLILTVMTVTQIYICDFVRLVLIMYYGYVRCNHGRKLRKGYTGPLCIIFMTFNEFIIVPK